MGSIWDYYNAPPRANPELGLSEQEVLAELAEQQESDEQPS
ncbi:hypothetical protein ACGF12_34925 [Kitasatospora sp. NPDC048296]